MSSENQELYTEEEADAILRQAVRLTPKEDSLIDRDRLNAIAAELGITPEQIDEAHQIVKKESDRNQLWGEFLEHRRRASKDALAHFVGSAFTLIGINLVANGFHFRPGEMWSIWIVGIWGGYTMIEWIQSKIRGEVSLEEEFEKFKKKRFTVENYDDKQLDNSHIKSVLDQYFSMHSAADHIGAIRELRAKTGLPLRIAKGLVDDYCAKRSLS